MKPTFLKYDKPILTTILQCRCPEVAKYRIAKALEEGAEAFGLQTESLLPEYWNEETIKELFAAMQGSPFTLPATARIRLPMPRMSGWGRIF